MKVDCIVIGQGISGSFLSYYLDKAGLSYVLIDESRSDTASRAASGVINPVTGRRMVKTWMIEELLVFARQAYKELESTLQIQCVFDSSIIDFFPTPQMRNAFLERMEQDPEWFFMPQDEESWQNSFHYYFGYGEIPSCLLIDLRTLLQRIREDLKSRNRIREQRFEWKDLNYSDSIVHYGDLSADRIVFCDGIEAGKSPLFEYLPFAPNKGEALIVEIPGLPNDHIYKKGSHLVPWSENVFWVGSSYEWNFSDPAPTEAFRRKTESWLTDLLRIPFKTLDHFAAVRPATLERRPFVGFHPRFQNVGLLNGMGTKGCSLAPFFASQLVQHIVENKPIYPEADLKRFAGILSRGRF